MAELDLFEDSMGLPAPLLQDRNLFEMRPGWQEPRGWAAPRMVELVAAMQTQPLSLRLHFGLSNDPDRLGSFREDRLRGLGWVQRVVRDRGQRFDVGLWFGVDRVGDGGSEGWHPAFPFELGHDVADNMDFIRRLVSMGWAKLGWSQMLDAGFWQRFVDVANSRGSAAPIGYAGDGAGGPYYVNRAVILDPRHRAYYPWLVRQLTELTVRLRSFGDFFWILACKDKHYHRDERFNEPGRNGWAQAQQTARPWPEWIVQGHRHSGLWSVPTAYQEVSLREVRTRIHEVVADARLPAVSRIWLPEGLRYDGFFTRDVGDLNLGWCR